MAGMWSDHFPASEKTPERFSASSSKTTGTWTEHYPSAEKPPSLPVYKRCFLCRTCDVICRIFTSKTPQNPNRQFYKCPVHQNFFKWADEVRPDEFIDVPNCGGCPAGTCRVKRFKSGPNSGRVLFMCRIKEGEGSCGYSVWQDEFEKEAIHGTNENISSQSPTFYSSHTATDFFHENRQSNGKSNNESTVTDNSSHHPDYHGVTSKQTEHLSCWENQSPTIDQRISGERVTPTCQSSSRNTISSNRTKDVNNDLVEENYKGGYESSRRAYRLSDVTITLFPSPTVEENNESREGDGGESPVIDTLQEMKGQENVSNWSSSRRPYKRSRHGDLKAPSSLVSSQPLTVGPTMNPVLVEHYWMVAAIRENLSAQLQGWWGRLAFFPMPSLTTHASKPLTCYVSSPISSTFTSQEKNLVKPVDLTLPKILIGAETHNKSLLNPCHITQFSRTKPFPPLNMSPCTDPAPETSIQAVMSESISKMFTQVAEHLQNDFLDLLRKMDVADYEAMSREAEATFSALDRLLFNYQDFKGHTEEYINCAYSLAEIERSMPRYESYQKQIEHFSNERMRYDEVSSDYAKAVDYMNSSRKRLKSLQAKVSSTVDLLFQMEAELSCLEEKMRVTELEVEKISKNKEVLEEKYATAAIELEKSRELIKRKEAERDKAKVALERARGLLRG